jgi:hypothetical protein
MRFVEIKTHKPAFELAGFLPFTDGASVTGMYTKKVFKSEKKGFFIVQSMGPITVNIDTSREEHKENKTGQATAPEGSYIGIRSTHALSSKLTDDLIGRVVRITFIGSEKLAGQDGTEHIYHRFTVEVGQED